MEIIIILYCYELLSELIINDISFPIYDKGFSIKNPYCICIYFTNYIINYRRISNGTFLIFLHNSFSIIILFM